MPAVGLKHAREAVAHGRASAVTHMQGAGWIGRDKLDLQLARGTRAVATVFAATLKNPGNLGMQGGSAQMEIDETRSGDLDLLDARIIDRRHQQLGNLARLAPRLLGQGHGHVAGKITVFPAARALNHETGRNAFGQGVLRAQGCERSVDQLAQGVFHGGIRWQRVGHCRVLLRIPKIRSGATRSVVSTNLSAGHWLAVTPARFASNARQMLVRQGQFSAGPRCG